MTRKLVRTKLTTYNKQQIFTPGEWDQLLGRKAIDILVRDALRGTKAKDSREFRKMKKEVECRGPK